MENRIAKATILLCVAVLHIPLACLLRKLTHVVSPPAAQSLPPLAVEFVAIPPAGHPPPMIRRSAARSVRIAAIQAVKEAKTPSPSSLDDAPIRIPGNLLEEIDRAGKPSTFHAPWSLPIRGRELDAPGPALRFAAPRTGAKYEPCLRYRNFALGSTSTDGSNSCDRKNGSRAEAPDLIRYGEDDADTIERKRREWEEYDGG